MSKLTSMELTNSLVAYSGGVGDNNYDDLFREEEDTGEEGNINIPRPAKKSRAETKQMSDDGLFLYFQELHTLWGGEGFRECCSVGEATTVSSFVASRG